RDLMNRATGDCLVTGYESLLPTLELPDDHDRHVLAAAVVGRCDVIVTQNLKHFPGVVLAPFGIEAQHPDDFLSAQLSLAPGQFSGAVRKVRARLRNPPYSATEYLETLIRQGLVATAAGLDQFKELL
ncbi:MAG: PIN domain-containing protein, partial [Bryobacteraceae bacterium]